MNHAGVGIRFVAVLIDSIILLAITWIIAKFTGGTTETGFSLTGGPALLSFLIWFAYYIILEVVKGATIGKMAVGLRVVDVNGDSINWGKSIIRNILRIVDGFLVYLVAAILVWVTAKNQRLGDLAAGTLVVRK